MKPPPNNVNPYETIIIHDDQDKQPTPPPQPRRNWRLLALVAGVLVVALLASVAILWGQTNTSPSTKPVVRAQSNTPPPTAAPTLTASSSPARAIAVPSRVVATVTAKPRPTIPPTATPPTRAITVRTAGDAFAFQPDTINVKSGEKITLTFAPESTEFHTWVLARGGNDVADAVSRAGLQAGEANNYTQPDAPNVIAGAHMSNKNQSSTIIFTAPKPGTYTFLCTMPGHFATGMFGTFVVS